MVSLSCVPVYTTLSYVMFSGRCGLSALSLSKPKWSTAIPSNPCFFRSSSTSGGMIPRSSAMMCSGPPETSSNCSSNASFGPSCHTPDLADLESLGIAHAEWNPLKWSILTMSNRRSILSIRCLHHCHSSAS